MLATLIPYGLTRLNRRIHVILITAGIRMYYMSLSVSRGIPHLPSS